MNSKQGDVRRLLVVALAVLVFMLAMRAKLALYDPPQAGSINPAAASKLWVSGEKAKPLASTVPAFWLSALLFLLLPLCRLRWARPVDETPSPCFVHAELYRFLRPPPSF